MSPPSSDNTLPRRTPPTQHRFQTLPRTPRASPPAGRRGEYRYAQDRLNYFRLAPEQGGAPAPSTVLQLYEWQQRYQFRHGSPTAPLYSPAPEYPFGPRPPSALLSPQLAAPRPQGQPRCVSVPPSPADIPPPGPLPRSASPGRRPHTPAERLTVRPGEGRSEEPPARASPRRSQSQLLKVGEGGGSHDLHFLFLSLFSSEGFQRCVCVRVCACVRAYVCVFQAPTLDRLSTPSGYITHTVSAPSLHGKTVRCRGNGRLALLGEPAGGRRGAGGGPAGQLLPAAPLLTGLLLPHSRRS